MPVAPASPAQIPPPAANPNHPPGTAKPGHAWVNWLPFPLLYLAVLSFPSVADLDLRYAGLNGFRAADPLTWLYLALLLAALTAAAATLGLDRRTERGHAGWAWLVQGSLFFILAYVAQHPATDNMGMLSTWRVILEDGTSLHLWLGLACLTHAAMILGRSNRRHVHIIALPILILVPTIITAMMLFFSGAASESSPRPLSSQNMIPWGLPIVMYGTQRVLTRGRHTWPMQAAITAIAVVLLLLTSILFPIHVALAIPLMLLEWQPILLATTLLATATLGAVIAGPVSGRYRVRAGLTLAAAIFLGAFQWMEILCAYQCADF